LGADAGKRIAPLSGAGEGGRSIMRDRSSGLDAAAPKDTGGTGAASSAPR
jgi:hypothetical protein